MKIRGVRIPAGVLAVTAGVFCFALVLVASDFFPSGNPHVYFQNAQQCLKCHLSYQGKMEPTRFSTETDAVCFGCHRKDSLGRSHPVTVRPREKYWKMKVPPDFRLDDGGRMMCLTCHTAHSAYLSTVKAYPKQVPISSASSGGPYYKTLFLRRSSPTKGWQPLCSGCHEEM
jgi:predicted CXXCH cytochrome family protein